MVDKKRVEVKEAKRSLSIPSKWRELDELEELMMNDFPKGEDGQKVANTKVRPK